MTGFIKDRLAALPESDRRLLILMTWAALAALALGIMGGLLTALARGGLIDILPEAAYRALTLHGVSIFFYWLYIAQAALLLGFASIEGDGTVFQSGLSWRPMAGAGCLAMIAGFFFSMAAASRGTPLLYDGAPELADDPANLLLFNAGYLLLGIGLIMVAAAAIATLLDRRKKSRDGSLSAVGFALFAWAGFLIVSGFAALHAFVPGALWALELGPFPASHRTSWHILFHNMHYLPLMATVLMWYVLIRALTGVESIFGARFSKIVFAMYLVFVPPTSLYHMFLEPDLPAAVRTVGSLLSLFVSVPTLTAFLIIVASLEVHARTEGARGLFGWIAKLPWRQPPMAAIGVAVVNMGLGLVFAFVLIQEKLAPLLSDTFFVPGYFHFFTVGTVSLTLLAALAVMLPSLLGRPLAWPGFMRLMPWMASAGLLVFGGAGVMAGYLGVPRRVIDVTYGDAAPSLWKGLMAAVGAGGTVMALALLGFAAGIAATLLSRQGKADHGQERAFKSPIGGEIPARATAWVGPVSVLAIVAMMYVFTAIGFEVMQNLPISADGGGQH